MRDDNRLPLAVGLDVFAVVLFAALGRRTHDEDGALVSVLAIAAPFLIGLLTAWIALRAWRRPSAIITGLAAWPITVAVGMVLRRTVWDRGTALSFVIVATAFLGVAIVGWRLVLRRVGPAGVAG